MSVYGSPIGSAFLTVYYSTTLSQHFQSLLHRSNKTYNPLINDAKKFVKEKGGKFNFANVEALTAR